MLRFWVGYSGTRGRAAMYDCAGCALNKPRGCQSYQSPCESCLLNIPALPLPSFFSKKNLNSTTFPETPGFKKNQRLRQHHTLYFSGPQMFFAAFIQTQVFLLHPFLCSVNTPGRSGGKESAMPPSPRHHCLQELPRLVHQTQNNVNIHPNTCDIETNKFLWPKLSPFNLVNKKHSPNHWLKGVLAHLITSSKTQDVVWMVVTNSFPLRQTNPV